MSLPFEAELQSQILEYLAHEMARGRVGWFCRVNGGAVHTGHEFIRFYQLHIPGHAGRSAGKADIEGLMGNGSATPGRYFALEVKSATGRATREQREFLAAVREVGGIGATVRSFEDVKSVLFGEIDPERDQTPYEARA